MQPILITSASIADTPHGDCVLRGVIDPMSLHSLQVDDYQREVLPVTSINKLVRAFDSGTLPDIELGMRGEDFEEQSSGQVVLRDPTFIIDGLQRVSAAKFKVERGDELRPFLGALIHIGTNQEWERQRFSILNLERSKLSPNVAFRNLRYDYQVIELLYALCADRGFVLHQRVCWQQRMRREELITATTCIKVIGRLHAHLGPTLTLKSGELANNLQKVMARTGKGVFRDNVKTFFAIIDEAWGIRDIAFKEGAVHMHSVFLTALARVFSQHEDFWRDNRLFIDAPMRRKLRAFPFRDPQVRQLSSSGGKAGDILYMLLVDHLNSGKRTKRLKPRNVDYPVATAATEGELVADGVANG